MAASALDSWHHGSWHACEICMRDLHARFARERCGGRGGPREHVWPWSVSGRRRLESPLVHCGAWQQSGGAYAGHRGRGHARCEHGICRTSAGALRAEAARGHSHDLQRHTARPRAPLCMARVRAVTGCDVAGAVAFMCVLCDGVGGVWDRCPSHTCGGRDAGCYAGCPHAAMCVLYCA